MRRTSPCRPEQVTAYGLVAGYIRDVLRSGISRRGMN
jgi:hypothetical protein